MTMYQGVRKRRSVVECGESPIQDEAIRQQLAQLFCETLVGPWPQLQQRAGGSWQRRRSGVWFWLFAWLLLSAGVCAVYLLAKPGLEQRAEKTREPYALDLRAFLGDGDLERASQFVALLETRPGEGQAAIQPRDPHLDLIVASEAALYRYFDADPRRLRRIRPYVDDARRSSPLMQIAALTILSREERAARLQDLVRLRNDAPESNGVDYLLATALEHNRDAVASREAWERAAKLEPAWLGHRFEQGWFELRQDRVSSARTIGREMVRAEPASGWSRLALDAFGLPKEMPVVSIRVDAAAPATTPVQVHFQLLVQALLAARNHDFARAKERLGASAAAVQLQAPFLLDAFDWCLDENEPALAREIVSLPEWPSDEYVTKAKLARLSKLPSSATTESPLAAGRATTGTQSSQ
jgi:hypothetical protein